MLLPTAAFAQEAASSDPQAKNLEKVVVTGSLIPQTELETVSPVVTITADDIQARGFNSVAEVLQASTMASGGVQGGETSASFTQGAETVSMFGLKPGYTKYLINGRPIANYPALYNGSDAFNSISGIPLDAVERIEILPGGSSSLYGSDALAGVVNFILKQSYEGNTLRVRGGATSEGGGGSLRVSFTNGFSAMDGRLNAVTSAQYEKRDPVWGYQRAVADSVNQHGYTAPVASRDYLVYGYQNIATDGFDNFGYLLPDGIDCSTISGQFGGTEALQTRPGSGQYCGSFSSPGYRTIRNGKESYLLYNRTTFDLNDNNQLFVEVLGSHEAAEYATGSGYTWWGTGSKYGYYYDPTYDSFLNLQRAFSPEDMGGGGFNNVLNKDTTKSYTITIGATGSFGQAWDYTAAFTRNESRLSSRSWVRFNDAINDYFDEHVLGPQQGLDPYYGAYPVFTPDYAAFYTQMSPDDFRSFSGFGTAKAKTWDDLFRAQVTNSDLFSLPGGSAGLAVAVEAGNEGWDYVPIPGIMDGEIWGQTDVAGSGHRTKYAGMAELRLPVAKMLTATLSGRYDAFDAYGTKTDKPTWSAGLEFRPIESLLVRGKYGTAFKAPTLADQFQGLSGYYTRDTDYYRCGLEGYTPDNTTECTYNSQQYYGTQAGNTELKPIKADTWSAGIVWAPITNMSVSADYLSWDIKDEVNQLDGDQILLQEYYCRLGQAGPGLTSCENALSWVQRDPATGQLDSIFTPKVNIARQKLELIMVNAKYLLDIGNFGSLNFNANYTAKRKHELQTDPTQDFIDLINSPQANWVYDSGPKWKADASVGWEIDKWTTTLYANMLGSTPDYVAYVGDSFDYVNSAGVKAGKWGTWTTLNLSVGYRPMDNLGLTLMVSNIGNKLPDGQAYKYPGTSTTPYNSYLYSAVGRAIYAEMRYDFGK
ncbi:TonB-dependent receptor [Pseudoxanthomonas sp. JBR18]|uniref:TonB-dependent receptor plug domain-containing protein n=1 Tax=Pseudoxanthomonas sp. JBR18 TaxID=2969308 RepID=UPI0023057CB8|nr:TonB-dependent receptor [Pseudoxanthomonas sp. JBR18]WCE03303.1 TonB-dependent receptor [Pseudoxanthomonas sp. JBR18]